jgi:hypothetical protein
VSTGGGGTGGGEVYVGSPLFSGLLYERSGYEVFIVDVGDRLGVLKSENTPLPVPSATVSARKTTMAKNPRKNARSDDFFGLGASLI